MPNLHLLKISVWKQVRNKQGPWGKSKQWDKKYEKCQFCTQRRPKNLSSHKITKKAVLKNFLRTTSVGVSFLIKMQAYKAATLLKRHSNTGVFLTVIAKFLRMVILKNICERLLLRVFPFMLVWTFSYMNK